MGRDLWLRTSSYVPTSYSHGNHSKIRNRFNAVRKSMQEQTIDMSYRDFMSAVWLRLGHARVKSNTYTEMTTDLVLYLFIIMVCMGCYANSLDGDFVHDDLAAVTSNPDVTGRNSLGNLFLDDFWGRPMSSLLSHKSYRPLTVLTFRLNNIFCGLSPWSFHLVNILLHSAVCVLVTYLCLELLRWPRSDCATAALLFATHPIHTEVVSNVVGRAEVLSAFFFLASFISFTKGTKPSTSTGKGTAWMIVCLVFASLALLAKEQGIAVLPVCIVWRLVRLSKETRFTQAKILIKNGLCFLWDAVFWITLSMFVALIAFRLCMLQGTLPKFSDEDNPASFCPSALTRFLTYSYLVTFNAWLLLNPKTLSYDWQMGSLPLVTYVTDIRNLGTLLLFLFLLLLALKFCYYILSASTHLKKVESKTLLVALSIMVVPFLPASNIFVTVGFVVAERVLYIPSIGFCILVTFGLTKLRQRLARFTRFWKISTVLLILLFSARTVVRNQDWQSRETLFRSGLMSVPHNAKVHYNFANLQKDLGNVDSAVEHYREALRLWPSHASAHNNLGTLLPAAEDAERHFRSALIINPQHPRALFNLASLYSKQGRTKIAEELLQRALELDTEFTEAYLSLATIQAQGGRKEEAESLHLKAINIDPYNADSYNNYGIFLQKTGRVEEAVHQYKEAIRIQPNHTVAIINAARSLRVLKNNREAEVLYKRALALNPEPKIMDNLGVLYISAGRIADASKLYSKLALVHGDYLEGKIHFAQVLMQERSFQQAEQILTTVVQRNSTNRDALHQLSLLYSQVNRTTEALEYILKALYFCDPMEVNCAQMHVDHGDILKDLKQWNDAVQSYEMAIELEPRLSHAHVNLAVIKHLQGECHKALRHYHEAYVIDPDNQLLQENMRKLKLHLVDGSGICQTNKSSSCRTR